MSKRAEELHRLTLEVAETIVGWKHIDTKMCRGVPPGLRDEEWIPSYSQSMSAAWGLVVRIIEDGKTDFNITKDTKQDAWIAKFSNNSSKAFAFGVGLIEPEAICKAALALTKTEDWKRS